MAERSPHVLHQEQHHEAAPLSPSPLETSLRESIADRYRAEGNIPELLPTPSPEELEHLTQKQWDTAERNTHFLHLLNGHRGQDLRTLAVNGKSPEAQFLSYVLSWSKEAAEQRSISLLGLASEIAPPHLGVELDEEQLYERICLYEKYPETNRAEFVEEQSQRTAEALGIEGENVRWMDMIDTAFSSKSAIATTRALLERVGSIPTELMNKRKFRGVRGENVAAVLGALSEMESTEETNMTRALGEASHNRRERKLLLDEARKARELMEQARHERAKVLNYFFIGRNAEQLRRKDVKNIALDSNGLFIQLRGFQSHIPYGLITPDMFSALQDGGWIDEIMARETALRKAQENTELAAQTDAKQEQLLHFARVLKSEGTPEELTRRFSRVLRENPEEFGKLLVQNNLILPDVLITELTAQGAGGVSDLMRTAEAVGSMVTGEKFSQEKNRVTPYDVLHRTEDAYTAQVKVLNHPDYYNVPKIARMALGTIPESNPQEQFLAFRGRYRRTREGDQHSFIETVHEGKVARVLVNEDKHLNRVRKEYNRLPLFEKARYTELEGALQSYTYFKNQIDTLRDLESYRDKRSGRIAYSDTYTAIESCLQFLLNNVTMFYRKAEGEWNKYFEVINSSTLEDIQANRGNPQILKELQSLIAIFDSADKKYAQFLYSTVGSETNFIETFVPDVEKKDIQFGDAFLEKARIQCAPDGYDEALCQYDGTSRIIQVHYKAGDPSETIPYATEETVVNRLGIPRGRPLINIIGGARQTTTEEGGANDIFSQAVMKAAHEHKANVGVPGTQSGIGTLFGRRSLEYTTQMEHLPDRDKVHLFSVNPGGNLFYPGNPFLEGTPQNEIFALSPVPSIITPFKAKWELKGRERYESPYRLHVAYIEALYRRMSDPRDRLMVVGNGGLYALFEVNASIDNNFKLFLVRNTGRFADVASLFNERLYQQDLNPRVLSNEEFSKRVIERVKSRLPADVAQEFFEKDFGFEVVPENENYEVYRHFFREYMMRVTKGYYTEIRSFDLERLEEMLTSYFSPEEKKYRASRLPYESI